MFVVSLPHRRSTTVSLETNPLYSLLLLFVCLYGPGNPSFFYCTLQEGTVLSYEANSGAVTIELTKESLKKARGMFVISELQQ